MSTRRAATQPSATPLVVDPQFRQRFRDVGRVRPKPAIWPLFWPGLIGCLVFLGVSTVLPRPAEAPFQLVWLLCLFATSWVAGYVVRALLEARHSD
jgi:hypothetical protein